MSDNKSVLLSVDDEESVLKALQRSLRKVDIEIVTALSGKAGLDILKQRQVDVIVSDIRMPHMSGAEFLKAAAAIQPTTTRIALTGYADPEETKAAINEGGVTQFLSKPWDDDELRRIITEAATVARLKRENQALAILTENQNEELRALNEDLEALIAARTQELEHTNGILTTALDDLKQNHQRMVDLVANIAALPNTECEIARNKVELALAIGEDMELDDEQLAYLREATRLHRLGLVALPHSIRDIPYETLTATQLEIYQQHPNYAEAVLLSVPTMKTVGVIIRQQHEHFNGKGFPDGCVRDGIPLASRILAVVRDYYDYQAGHITGNSHTPAQAFAFIQDKSNEQYDADIVSVLEKVLPTVTGKNLNQRETLIKTYSLLPDMRLARELTTEQGVVLLAKGSVLTEASIESLLNLERRSDRKLRIYIDSEPQ
jgi:adenylate cyclase